MDKYIKRIAEKIVKECIGIEKGNSVLILCGRHNIDFAEEIALECWKIGALPIITVRSDKYMKSVYNETSVEHLKTVKKHMSALFDELDVRIHIDAEEDPFNLKDIDEEKIGAKRQANQIYLDKMLEKEIKWAFIGYPTEKMAKAYNIEYEELKQMYFNMMDLDYKKLSEKAHKLKEKIHGKKTIRITAPETDLYFSIQDRRINIDDGMIDDYDKEIGELGLNLPSGEVFIAPIEDSANGYITFNTTTFYKGKQIKNLKLYFKDGRVVKSEADKGKEVFDNAVENAHGDKDKIAEFGIGLNPYAKAIGNILIDEKINHSIHIAIGENRGYGGVNKASIHWDLILLNPTVYADKEIIMLQGNLIL